MMFERQVRKNLPFAFSTPNRRSRERSVAFLSPKTPLILRISRLPLLAS